MKKKLLAILVAVAMVMSLLPVASFAAENDATYGRAYATGHTLGEPRDNVDVVAARTHPQAAYDAPDAEQNGKEIAFYSLRQVEDVTYTFHPSKDLERQIVNYRGTDEATKPDLSLIEVTWGTWHVEAVEVYLTDAVVNGVPVDKYKIGTAFNKAGIDKIAAKAPGYENVTLAQSFHKEGNFGYTDIFFPNEVDSAMGVKLVDVTTKYNTDPYTPGSTYNEKDDGYDLDAICAWYTRDIPVTVNGIFSVQKFVEDENGDYSVATEDFVFEAYTSLNEETGEPDTTTFVGSATTDTLTGVATFKGDEIVAGKTYYVVETLIGDQKLTYQYGAKNSLGFVKVVAAEKTEAPTEIEFYNDLIPGNGSLVIGKGMGEYVSYSSVTGGYADEGINARANQTHNLDNKLGGKGNWFQYNVMDGTSAKFDLVTGNNLTKVGEYTISYANGEFTITLDPSDALKLSETAKISIANKMDGSKKLKKNTFDTIWTSSPGQQSYTLSFDENNVAVIADKANVDFSKPVYIYMHLGLAGYVGTYGQPAGTTFDVKVTGPSYPEGEVIAVPMNGAITLDNLKPGTYKVEEIEQGWIATYFVGDAEGVEAPFVNVTVKRDEATKVKLTNEPGEVVNPNGVFAVQKLVEEDGDYVVAAEEFTFHAYAAINEETGKPDLDTWVGTETTDPLSGTATFNADTIIAGETYYIFEEMTPDQTRIYQYGTQNLRGYVPATAEVDTPTPVAVEFYNDLKLGELTVTKTVDAKKVLSFGDNTVTGGDNASIDPVQGSWQRPVYLNVDAILAGTPYVGTLVAGSNLTPVGKYTVSAIDDGGLAVDLDFDAEYEGLTSNAVTMVAFGNDNVGVSQGGKNGISGDNSNNGSGLYMTDHFGERVIIEADVVENFTGTEQYFYLHSGIGKQKITTDITDEYANEVFEFEVTDADGIVVGEFSLKNGEEKTLELEPGSYTVTETTTGWETTYDVEGPVAVERGKEILVNVTNSLTTTVEIV